MRSRTWIVVLLAARIAAAATPSPTDVVDRQIAAYNAKDTEAFLKLYSPDAEMFDHEKVGAKTVDAKK